MSCWGGGLAVKIIVWLQPPELLVTIYVLLSLAVKTLVWVQPAADAGLLVPNQHALGVDPALRKKWVPDRSLSGKESP